LTLVRCCATAGRLVGMSEVAVVPAPAPIPPPPAPPPAVPAADGPVKWKDPRFQPAIEKVRSECGIANHEDDPMIGMLLDRYSWDHGKVVELYKTSLARREALGVAKVKDDIVKGGLGLDQLPHAQSIRSVFRVNGASSVEKPEPCGASSSSPDVEINGRKVAYGDVIGCYELRYGHGSAGASASAPAAADEPPPVTPAEFTKYMVYVTQWRWLQCEEYIRRHGELGFWSMIHDISCPAGYYALWGRMRSLLGQYMPPVEEACAGLFPPMVQKILIINVPRIFSPAWSIISTFLPKHHQDRIVLLSTSYTSAEEVSKYVPPQHMPPHLKQGRPDGPD